MQDGLNVTIVTQCFDFCILRKHRMASLMVILAHISSLTIMHRD